ncbi:MAG: hypothetical protein M5T52_20755 [Ignavibacteriaceae bacterium]|nr:hypothetical protein [Ignavibacteriaceae bacterium]
MGWTVGDGMTGFYRTTDGGENWIAGVGLYSSVFFIDQNIGWTTNDEYNTGIFKSTDGGITWIQKVQSVVQVFTLTISIRVGQSVKLAVF